MRILIVNTFYYPNMQGGAEQSVKLLAEGLVKKGHEVGIYCVDSKEKRSTKEEYNGVTVFRNHSHKFNLYKFSYEKNKVSKLEKIYQKLLCYYNKGCLEDFKKTCEEFKPDIIHTNTTFGISEYVWKEAYKLNIPLVHTIRDTAIVSPTQYGHNTNIFVKIFHRAYMRYVTKYVAGITAPSNYTLNTSLNTKCFKNAKVKKCIFNSVKIDYNELDKILKEKEKRTNKIIKFMYAGRLIYFKGIEHMIYAFEELNNDKYELHICGDGEMIEFVKEWSAKDKRIIYHGKLNNDELKKCYIESDVLLVPSYWPEPFGRVLIEGNAYGLPCIVGNCGGMPEIIENTSAGVTYAPNNKKKLAEAMKKFDSRKEIKRYYKNIKNNISIYDIEHQITQFEKLYQELSEGE